MIVDFEKYESRLREELTEKQFEAFYRMAHEDKTLKQVAGELGIGLPAVKNRLWRSRAKIDNWYDKPKTVRRCGFKHCEEKMFEPNTLAQWFCSRLCYVRHKAGYVPRTREQMFWDNVDIRGMEDCWLWKAGTTGVGYGNFSIDGTYKGAHVIAFEMFKGRPVKPGMWICHNCFNKLCVNPFCLREDTPKGNLNDIDNVGENNSSAKLSSNTVVTAIALVAAGCSIQSVADWLGINHNVVWTWVRQRSRTVDHDKYVKFMRRNDESNQQAQG